MAVGRRIAAVGRRAVRRTTAAVSPLAVALATFALAAFALAALVNELDIGWWPWWVVAGVVAVASAGLWWVLPFVGFLAMNLAAAFALAALVNELDIGWPWWVVASVVAVASTGWSWSVHHGRIAELEARLGRDSTNSSQPPSADSIAAKAKRRADRSSRERSKDRKPGGQPGRVGSGLAPTTEPDRTETVSAPTECAGCAAGLGEAADAGTGWAQVCGTSAGGCARR